ncbi:MAG: hypothetical protein KatS3mg057_0490 [Herpetosiphonaceae bacterium]|nr:MAG: hypothetical protein KatS3mg057_0490 [Herpetosiphonaceae bacterium]
MFGKFRSTGRVFRAIMLLTLLTFLLASCGGGTAPTGGGDTSTQPTNTTVAANPTTAPEPTEAAQPTEAAEPTEAPPPHADECESQYIRSCSRR